MATLAVQMSKILGWDQMKLSTAIFAILLLSLPSALFAQNDATSAAPATLMQLESNNPKEVYDRMCAGCHGYRGDGGEGHRGGFSPHIGTLANKEYMAGVTDDYLEMIIKKGGAYMGKIATMPAWEKKFSEDLIREIVAHIRTF
jgi:mono/diheme cytochrome c family protein